MEQNNNTHEHTAETPRIYVASLSDYSNGRLHGRWIDADQPAETIREQIAQMLAASEDPAADEWAIHAYAGFADLWINESEDINCVAKVAFLMTQYGPVFASLAAYLGGASAAEEARRYMEEGYRGEFDSLADYAEELVEECYGDVLKKLPDFLRYHLDYEGIARDMELNGEVLSFECDRKVHVFEANI